MSVLVTGGSGFIGINLVKGFAKTGIPCVSFSRKGFQESFNFFIGPGISNVHFKKGNVLNPEEIRCAVREHGIKTFVHTAAITPGTPAMEQASFRDTMRINIEGTVNALEASLEEGVERFVYISSVAVYGPQKPGKPLNEDACLKPGLLYAVTKHAGEKLSLRFGELYKELEVRAARISSVYGPMERQTQTRAVLSHIHDWCQAAVSGRKVEVWDDPTLERDFTHVEDITDGIILLSMADSTKNKVYNFSSGKSYSLKQVLEAIKKYHPGFEFKVVSDNNKGEYMRVLPRGPLDISRARKDLGYNVKYGLKKGISCYLDWLRSFKTRDKKFMS